MAEKGSSSSDRNRCVADMFDRMKSFDYFRIDSNLQSASSGSSSRETCWLTPKSLGILDGISLFNESTGGGRLDVNDPSSSTADQKISTFGTRTTTGRSLFNNLDLTKYVNAQTQRMSLTHRIEQLATEYVMAVAVGAIAGAAVATGVGVGLLAMSGFSRLTNDYLPSLYHWLFPLHHDRNLFRLGSENGDSYGSTSRIEAAIDEEERRTSTITSRQSNSSCHVSLIPSNRGTDQVMILQGKVQDAYKSSFEQCRQALKSVSVILSKQSLGWKNVKRVTAYLANHKCHSKAFRQALSEFPIEQQQCIVTILYVARLEDPRSVVEVEIMAAADPQ